MTKEEKRVFEQYCKDYYIDSRTLGMIGHHYLFLGEQIIATLTPEEIEETVFQEKKKQEKAEKEGKVYMIDPSFTEYLLNAVVGLYKINGTYRYKILKEII